MELFKFVTNKAFKTCWYTMHIFTIFIFTIVFALPPLNHKEFAF